MTCSGWGRVAIVPRELARAVVLAGPGSKWLSGRLADVAIAPIGWTPPDVRIEEGDAVALLIENPSGVVHAPASDALAAASRAAAQWMATRAIAVSARDGRIETAYRCVGCGHIELADALAARQCSRCCRGVRRGEVFVEYVRRRILWFDAGMTERVVRGTFRPDPLPTKPPPPPPPPRGDAA